MTTRQCFWLKFKKLDIDTMTHGNIDIEKYVFQL